jgi:ribonuclease HI
MVVSPRRPSKSLPGQLPESAPGEVLVWTDGACPRNPGPGGWAALVCWEDGVVEQYSGGLAHTTNNIMEMTAALQGLRALPPRSRACVVTDSRYVHDGMTSWMAGWRRKGWKTASGDPVKNKEIWVQLAAAASARHSGGCGSDILASAIGPRGWLGPDDLADLALRRWDLLELALTRWPARSGR